MSDASSVTRSVRVPTELNSQVSALLERQRKAEPWRTNVTFTDFVNGALYREVQRSAVGGNLTQTGGDNEK